uniref:periaxin-like isoform X3 n=1 Tax=Podarcis muralis TaxID=64176 RepID=UPI0010A04506|nr:periaxin-like isoform X3 [Podarcis muralis]
MKTFWLALGSLFAFAAAGTGQEASKRNVRSVEDTLPSRQARSLDWPWYCPGCFTAINKVPAEKEPLLYDPDRFQIHMPSLQEPEPSPQHPAKTEEPLLYDPDRFQIHMPSLQALDPSLQEASKRNVRSVEDTLPSRQARSLDWPWYCPGCHTPLHQVPAEKEPQLSDPDLPQIQMPSLPALEPSLQHPAKTEEPLLYDPDRFQIHMPSLQALDPSLQEASKRNVRSVEDTLPSRQARSLDWPWYCPGCHTPLHQVPAEKEPQLSDPDLPQIQMPSLPALEPSLQRPAKTEEPLLYDPDRFQIHMPSLQALDPSLQEASKRNVRSVEDILLGGDQGTQERRQNQRRYCSSCYTPLHQVPSQKEQPFLDPDLLRIHIPTLPTRDPSPQELLFKAITKRSARGAASARARGKQRSGARAVCRGCYSGLMIVAPPAQGSKNETWIGSHSESEGDSSEEDTLPPKA